MTGYQKTWEYMIGLLPGFLEILMLYYVATRHPYLFYRLMKDRVFLVWFMLVYIDSTLLLTQLTPLIAQWLKQALSPH